MNSIHSVKNKLISCGVVEFLVDPSLVNMGNELKVEPSSSALEMIVMLDKTQSQHLDQILPIHVQRV